MCRKKFKTTKMKRRILRSQTHLVVNVLSSSVPFEIWQFIFNILFEDNSFSLLQIETELQNLSLVSKTFSQIVSEYTYSKFRYLYWQSDWILTRVCKISQPSLFQITTKFIFRISAFQLLRI